MPAISPDLRPLVLPQLVEERKRLEQQPDGDLSHIYYTTNSSSSDVGSPVTPTFSARGHHRYSSSVSSLELSTLAESPSSPAQPSHSAKPSRGQLPDVEEEPSERDDEDILDGLYDCLCDEPFCVHRSAPNMLDRPAPSEFDTEYDFGFLSDTDLSVTHERRNVRLGSAEAALSGITSRIGSRLPGIGRWKGLRKNSAAALSVSELSADSGGLVSHAPSSRSSSISSPMRPNYPHSSDATISASPRYSFWESTESVVLPTNDTDAGGRREAELNRRLATTPLLPPLITDSNASAGPLSPGFPFPHPVADHNLAPHHAPTPSLATKPSTASFRPSLMSPELPIPFPNMLNDDSWSDRLGHANFTILPTPYTPDDATPDALSRLRSDWDLARVNYTKHLYRTGENYGETSKIYGLTQDKWAEVEGGWRRAHDEAVGRVLASSNVCTTTATAGSNSRGSGARSRSRGRGRGRSGSVAALGTRDEMFSGVEWRPGGEGGPAALPRMLGDKFPSRGDEDIVGPMVREEAMRGGSVDGRGARLWKNFMGKVGGLRR